MFVYLLFDNSWRDPQVIGVFASREAAQQWLDNEYASGALAWHEYETASIEKCEVVS